ncbi:MAG TPA: excinuclease ABC subunit UvrC [Solirubrobacteraceae bacterium]|jgi:excinuclease ABC subunit C|nr:excinuclease ABC subunit UvrC [Solirubrobacteraceae bacterium]
MSIVTADRRRDLPDEPGVYLFHDARGKVIYVGKAISIKKRVASHFSNPSTRAGRDLLPMIDRVEALVVQTESEALIVEQNFIRQYQPRFNIRLRDDKSYPYIAISLDEDFPRVYFTRERHRRDRAYFGPFSSAKRVRSTLDVLGKVFLFRTCEGSEPGRRSGSPCLDYYIKRCEAPCVGYVSKQDYRAGIDGVIGFLSGRYKEIEQRLEFEMNQAAAEQRYEDAARERNRLQAVRRLLERQRVSVEQGGTFDAIAIAVHDGEANAQVLQVRDGVLSDRQSFYLDNAADAEPGEVTEAFVIQYYASAMMIPPLVVVESGTPNVAALAQALSERRGSRVEVREPERGDKRRILELAQRNSRLALDQEKLRSERRRQQRTEALDRLQQALGLDTLPLRIECYDISTLMGTNTVASMVVFEGAVPKKSDYRRFRVRTVGEAATATAASERAAAGETNGAAKGDYGPDDFASMEEILGRRMAQFEAQADLSPHDKEFDPSFAALPNLIVIDGGKGQLAAGLRALQGFVDRGVPVVSLAKRIEEVFVPGRADSLVLPHDTPELQLLQRLRDEAHRFAITHHRQRRDQAMTASILDGLPGVGPARKRALLTHFGSPDAVLEASREELEAVPGIPGKLARELHRELHKTGV